MQEEIMCVGCTDEVQSVFIELNHLGYDGGF